MLEYSWLKLDKKLLALSNDISVSRCAIVCLQETTKPLIDLAFMKTCFPKRFDKFAFVTSRGALGGILTIWNRPIFIGVVAISNDFVWVSSSLVCFQLSPGPYITFMAHARVRLVMISPNGCMAWLFIPLTIACSLVTLISFVALRTVISLEVILMTCALSMTLYISTT